MAAIDFSKTKTDGWRAEDNVFLTHHTVRKRVTIVIIITIVIITTTEIT
jgi:hypothetical protein